MFESIPFPIYMESESTGAFSLLVSKGDQLSGLKRRQIQKHSRGMVYIQSEYYAAEAERALDNILADSEKDVEEKVPLFFSYATERLAEVFQRISEEGGQNATLVLPAAEQALGLVQQDWKAAFSLLQLAQKSPETYAHSLNVCLFGLSYVQNYVPMYSEGELKEIAFGFLSHDIGELLVSDDLLNKKSRLTPIERKIIRQIPLHGHKVLMESDCDYPPAVEIVMNHHRAGGRHGLPARVSGKSDTPSRPRLHRLRGVRYHDDPARARSIAKMSP
jgi:HD-GYP domain-containing protein (c-di-GMP phosphodiesterase class II)